MVFLTQVAIYIICRNMFSYIFSMHIATAGINEYKSSTITSFIYNNHNLAAYIAIAAAFVSCYELKLLMYLLCRQIYTLTCMFITINLLHKFEQFVLRFGHLNTLHVEKIVCLAMFKILYSLFVLAS